MAAIPVADFDKEEVARQFKGTMQTNKLVVKIRDLGGQRAFGAQQALLINQHSVMVIAFDMRQLRDEATRERCLEVMSDWLNKVVVYTYNETDKTMAPIIFVGTHKDLVDDPVVHGELSSILFNHFKRNIAFSFIIPNKEGETDKGRTLLYFFPVDNTRSREDKVTKQLLAVLEDTMIKSDSVNEQIPLGWLKLLDALIGLETPLMPLTDVVRIAASVSVPESQVEPFLKHMTNVGVLLWLDESVLKDTLITDPTTAFIEPSCSVIRKLQPTGDDPTVHMSDLHRECARQFREDFIEMIDTGIVSDTILNFLLGHQGANVQVVMQLMIRYSLMVPVVATRPSEGGNISCATKYIFPSLLPLQLPPALQGKEWSQNNWHTAIIFFSTTSSQHSNSTLTKSELEDGFNPPELFTLLLAKVLSYSNKHKPEEYRNHLSQDMVVIYLDTHRVRLTNRCNQSSNRPNLNSIQVDVEGDFPLGPLRRILGMIGKVKEEVMPMLHCSGLVPVAEGGANIGTVSTFLSLSALENAVKDGRPVLDANSNVLFPPGSIPQSVVVWASNKNPRAFHLFGSYRWDKKKTDQGMIVKEYEEMSMSTVGNTGKGIDMFADIERLKMGRPFQEDFVEALLCSKIGVPHITPNALERLLAVNFNAAACDNVLIEWILMLQLHRTSLRVYPIAMGNFIPASSKREKFDWDLLDQLSEEFPEVSIRKLEELLELQGKELAEDFKTMTVKEIVKSLMAFKTDSIVEEETADNAIIEKACCNLKAILNDIETESAQPVEAPVDVPVSVFITPTTVVDFSDKAWAILHDTKQVKDQAGLSSYLNEKGIEEKDHLAYMTREHVEVIAKQYLKDIGGRMFQQAMKTIIAEDA